MQKIVIKGRKVNFVSRNENNTKCIIFLHGAGGSSQIWSKQINYFARFAHVISLDLPGHGLSEGPVAIRLEEYASFLKDFIDELSLDKQIILVGHSMGGAVAQLAAAAYPERISKLILISTGATLPVNEAILADLQKGFFNPKLNQLAFSEKTSLDLVRENERVWQQVEVLKLYQTFKACNVFSAEEILPLIKSPIALIFGADDRFTPPSNINKLLSCVTKVQSVIIKDAGHMVMLEKPHEFNTALKRFVCGEKQ